MANNGSVISVAPSVVSVGTATMIKPQVDTTISDTLNQTISAVPAYMREIVDEANKLRVQSAVNDFVADLNDYKYNAEHGIMNRVGRAVATPESGEAFSSEGNRGVQERIDKHFKGLNAAQKELAQKFIDDTRIKNEHEFLTYESKQIHDYSNDVYSNAVKNHSLNLAKMGWDTESRERDIQGIYDAIDSLGKTNGWSPDHIDYEKKKVVSGALQDVLTLLINQDNVKGAQKFFNEVGKAYQLDPKVLINARKRILASARAQQTKAVVNSALEGLQDCYTVGAQVGRAALEAGAVLPDDVKAKYDQAQTRQEKARILNAWVDPALKGSGGDLTVAVRSLLGEGAKDEDVKKIASAIHYGNAVEQFTEMDALNYVREMHPDMPRDEQIKMAKKVIDETRVQQALIAADTDARVTDALKGLQSGNIPNNFEQIDTTGWSPTQVQRAHKVWERDKRALTDPTEYNYGNETLFATLMQDPVKLSRMSEADLYALRADLSDSQWKQVFDRRQSVESANGDARKFHLDIDSGIKNELDAYLEKARPELLDSKHKNMYNVTLNRVQTAVKRTVNAEIKPGEVVDPIKLQRLTIRALHEESFWKGGPNVLEDANFDITQDVTLTNVFKAMATVVDGNLNPSDTAARATAESFLLDGQNGRVADQLRASPAAVDELLRVLPEYFLNEFIYSKDSSGKKRLKREYAENPQLILAKFVSTVRERGAGRGGRSKAQDIETRPWWQARALQKMGEQRKKSQVYSDDALEDFDIPGDSAPTNDLILSR